MIGLQEMVKDELTSDDMTVVLLLPTDDAPLPERAAALGEWCRGFLSGFGLARREYAMSEEASEVLRDLAAISQVQDALEESEDGETDYMEQKRSAVASTRPGPRRQHQGLPGGQRPAISIG